jgi:hypothetical protein
MSQVLQLSISYWQQMICFVLAGTAEAMASSPMKGVNGPNACLPPAGIVQSAPLPNTSPRDIITMGPYRQCIETMYGRIERVAPTFPQWTFRVPGKASSPSSFSAGLGAGLAAGKMLT